jgi:hypothetical protein
MNFVHYELGDLQPGRTVEATLDAAANVLLLDNPNFASYRSGRQYSYYGGWVTQTPYRIGIPYGGHWHIAIDLGGRAGNIRTAVRVL